MQIPKRLLKHPAVLRVEAGADAGTDYRFFVYLKAGYVFTESKCEGTNATCCGVNSYEQFIQLTPIFK
jgi:hypothetical protein